VIIIPNIKPVSDLRNYNEVLRDIAVGKPIFLTKNGLCRYAIMDMEDYERAQAKNPAEKRVGLAWKKLKEI